MKCLALSVLLMALVLVSACGKKDPQPDPGKQSALSGGISSQGPVGKKLFSARVAPAETEQTVSYEDKVAVTLPAGAIAAAQTLTISEGPKQPAHLPGFLSPIASYEISLNDQDAFKEAISIEVSHDPVPTNTLLAAAYWDDFQQVWKEVGVKRIAENRSEVTTDHLSRWVFLKSMVSFKSCRTKHFLFHLDPAAEGRIPKGFIATPAVTNMFTPQMKAWEKKDVAATYFLTNTMETYFGRYEAAGFEIPTSHHERKGQSFGIRNLTSHYAASRVPEKPEKINVYLFDADHDDTAHWDNLVGGIFIPDVQNTVENLEFELAHELFHTFQKASYSRVALWKWLWYTEATADYAAGRIAITNNTRLMGMDIGINYLARGLEYDSEAKIEDDPYTKHQYHTAHFMEFVTGRDPKKLKVLWDDVLGRYKKSMSFMTVSALDHLEASLSKEGLRLSCVYTDFAAWLALSSKSPSSDRPSDPQHMPLLLTSKRLEAEKTVTLLPDYTANAWMVPLAPGTAEERKANTGARNLVITIDEPLAKDVFLSAYSLRRGAYSDVMPVVSASLGDGAEATSVSVPITAGDSVCIITVNGSDRQQVVNLEVAVEEPLVEATCSTSPAKPMAYNMPATLCASFTKRFFADGKLVEPSKYEYRWHFGDSKKPEATKRQGNTRISHLYRRPGIFNAVVEVKDESGGTIGAASCAVRVLPAPEYPRRYAGKGTLKISHTSFTGPANTVAYDLPVNVELMVSRDYELTGTFKTPLRTEFSRSKTQNGYVVKGDIQEFARLKNERYEKWNNISSRHPEVKKLEDKIAAMRHTVEVKEGEIFVTPAGDAYKVKGDFGKGGWGFAVAPEGEYGEVIGDNRFPLKLDVDKVSSSFEVNMQDKRMDYSGPRAVERVFHSWKAILSFEVPRDELWNAQWRTIPESER